jgi:peptide/nickel transport system ATP-binding protein
MTVDHHRDDSDAPLLELDDVVKHYRLPRTRLLQPAPVVEALRGVSLVVRAGRNLGIVGESGSGKSTLARLAMALEAPTAGRVRILGHDLQALSAGRLRAARRDFQMVFQDPYGSLDPRQRVGRIVAEPLAALAGDGVPADMPAARRVAEALEAVGLHAADAARYPHEFSGGQRQRIAIARALITRPRLIVADEPVSALDVSVQAQVLNLFADLHERFGVTMLFIGHDLAVVDQVCDDVAVVFAGRVVEQGAGERVFVQPAHPYTRDLMAAMPGAGAGLPSPADLRHASARVVADRFAAASAGAESCSYAARCAWAGARCGTERPLLRTVAAGRSAACHFAEDVMNANEAPTQIESIPGARR